MGQTGKGEWKGIMQGHSHSKFKEREISEEEEEGKRTASSHGHEESSRQCEVLERPLSSTRK